MSFICNLFDKRTSERRRNYISLPTAPIPEAYRFENLTANRWSATHTSPVRQQFAAKAELHSRGVLVSPQCFQPRRRHGGAQRHPPAYPLSHTRCRLFRGVPLPRHHPVGKLAGPDCLARPTARSSDCSRRPVDRLLLKAHSPSQAFHRRRSLGSHRPVRDRSDPRSSDARSCCHLADGEAPEYQSGSTERFLRSIRLISLKSRG